MSIVVSDPHRWHTSNLITRVKVGKLRVVREATATIELNNLHSKSLKIGVAEAGIIQEIT